MSQRPIELPNPADNDNPPEPEPHQAGPAPAQNEIPQEPGEPAEPTPPRPSQPSPSQPATSQHPNDPAKDEVDSIKLAELLDLGFDGLIAELALKRTRGQCLEAAVNWIVDHSNDSDLDEDGAEDSEEDEELDQWSDPDQLSQEQLVRIMGANWSGASQQPGPSAMSRHAMVTMMKALRPARTHKMVFVANMSLKMGAGKLAAQVGHATLGVYKSAQKAEEGAHALEAWQRHGAVKVVVKGQSTEQLIDMFKRAKDLGLFAYLVQDAGYTQIPPGSRTVLGLFGTVEDVDQVSGQLKLL